MNVVFGNVRFRPQRGNRLIAVDLCVRLGRDNARPTALDCECLEGRDCSLGIVRVGNHAHLHLHRGPRSDRRRHNRAAGCRKNAHGDCPAAPSQSDRMAGRMKRSSCRRIRWRQRGGLIVKIELQIIGEEGMNVTGNHHRIGDLAIVDVLQKPRAIGGIAVPIVGPERVDSVLISAQLRHQHILRDQIPSRLAAREPGIEPSLLAKAEHGAAGVEPLRTTGISLQIAPPLLGGA